MRFNKHYDLEGEHAFLGGSKYHWVNYDLDKILSAYTKFQAVQRGVELHDFASRCIQLGQRLPKTKSALNRFVNDAIGYRMESEQPLVYSPIAFGTADAICFRDNILRIHDLKTGVSKVSMKQLEIYAALFCLEYNIKPHDIRILLRLYQGTDVYGHSPAPQTIDIIMDKIKIFDKGITKLKQESEE
jgi:hypothetical protein